MSDYHIVITGRPCSENRRLATRSFRLSKEYRSWKEEVAWSAMAAGVQEMLVGPVMVRVEYYHKHQDLFQDATSVLKGTLDSLNGIAWKDDRQIVRCCVIRERDAERPRVEVFIRGEGMR